jgi:hypothetical protein
MNDCRGGFQASGAVIEYIRLLSCNRCGLPENLQDKIQTVWRDAIMQSEIKYSGAISRTIPFWGSCFRLAVKIPLAGKMVGMTNKSLGRLLPSLSFLGFRKEASYENAIWNWEIFLKLIGAEYDAETISPQSKLYNIRKCPAGHCRLEHLEACKVTMELDNSLVESSGGRLIVDKRFPTDGICVEKIVPR